MRKDRIHSYIDDLYARNYVQRPVSIEELICSSEYFGRATTDGKTIYPIWKTRLQDIFDEDSQFLVVFTGAIGCLGSDVKISLLDGRELTIPEIIEERKEGKDIWVYSYDVGTESLKPGRVEGALLSGKGVAVVRVYLDNDEYVDCTSNHPFLLTTGEYVRADELKPGSSIMPLYRGKTKHGYEIIGANKGKWQATHKLIAESVYGEVKKGFCVHHKDFIKTNNSPDNLQVMLFKDHWTGQAKFGNSVRWAKKNAGKNQSEKMTEFWNSERGQALKLKWRNHKVLKVTRLRKKVDVYDLSIEKYHNFALTSGVFVHNTGKTTASVFGMCMVLHRLLCLRDPYEFFNHPKGSPFAFAFFNLTRTLSKGRAFRIMHSYLSSSPWFCERGNVTTLKSGLKVWSNEIIEFLVSTPWSEGTGIVGNDVICASMDEVDSRGGSESQKIKVIQSYDEIYTRFYTRFVDPVYKETIGKFFLSASKQEEASFLNTFVAERKDSLNLALVDIAQWDVKGDVLSGRKFSVALGDIYTESKILYTPAEIRRILQDGRTLIDIPIEYLEPFRRNITNALRELAGISVSALRTSKLFASEKIIRDCFDYKKQDPVVKTTILCGLKTDIQLIKFIDISQFRMPKSVKRFIHADFAYSAEGDCLGLAMSGIKYWEKRPVLMANGQYQNRQVPVVETDFVLRLKAPKGDQVHFAKVRELVLALVAKGYDITFSADLAAMSQDTFQILTTQGVTCEYLSVDRFTVNKPFPYFAFRSVVNDSAWICHFNDLLNSELKNLEHDKEKNTVDHPQKVVDIVLQNGHTEEVVRFGSKDMADAVCGSIFKALEYADCIPLDEQIMKAVMENLGRGANETETVDSNVFLGTDRRLRDGSECYVLSDMPGRYWLWTRKSPDVAPSIEGPYPVKPMNLDPIMANPETFIPENIIPKEKDDAKFSYFKDAMENIGR